MCKYFSAGDEYAVETTRDMDPEQRGSRMMTGRMKAHLTIYEAGDFAHPSLPTLRDFLADYTDPDTGLLTYEILGPKLTIDPGRLLALPEEYLDYRVSLGYSFVTNEAFERRRKSTGLA